MAIKRDSKTGIRNEWQHLDSAENAADFVAYLERVEASSYLRLYRESLLTALHVNDGDCLLENIGKRLASVFEDARFRVSSFKYKVLLHDNFKEVWPIMNFQRSMRQAAAEMDLSLDELKNWEKEIQAASKAGRFRIQFAGGICVGRKPEG